MPKLAKPLTDTQVKNAKPRAEPYTLPDGGSMYLEVNPSGSKIWRMSYRQANGKRNRITFGPYPAVSLLAARKQRDAARERKASGSDPAQARRDEKQAVTGATMHTFEAVARAWLKKTSATRAATTQGEITTWLQKDVFSSIGNMPLATSKQNQRRAARYQDVAAPVDAGLGPYLSQLVPRRDEIDARRAGRAH